MKKLISKYIEEVWTDKKAIFIAVILACSFLNLAYMHVVIGDVQPFWYYRYNTDSISFVLIDLLFIYLLPLLLVKRKTYIFLALYFFITLIAWINVGYSRYFHTYMPLSLYFATNNLNGLTNNIVDAIEASDVFFFITSSFVVLTFIYQKRNTYTKTVHIYPLSILLLCIIWIGFPFIEKIEKERERQHEHFVELQEHRSLAKWVQDVFISSRINSQKEAFFKYGFIINYTFEILHKDKKQEFPKKLEPYLSTQYLHNENIINRRNTILILVESLSSYALNKEYGGKKLTPTLNILSNEGYIFSKMESETQLGESSDGQFIYMTGYLPIKDDVAINSVADNKLLTLAHFFKKIHNEAETRMVIPTGQNAWSQATMCKTYGIDTLYSRDTYKGEAADWLNDEQLFKYAASKDIKSDKPFFSVILTSSTHSPWNKKFDNVKFQFPANFSSELKTYLTNVHYMDKWLGWYIESLKAKGIYDDTTIIIVADHKPNGPKLNIPDLQMCADIPLIIVNSPVKIENSPNERIYQTSVFPTILDLWGSDSDWRGVGYSLLYRGDKKS